MIILENFIQSEGNNTQGDGEAQPENNIHENNNMISEQANENTVSQQDK